MTHCRLGRSVLNSRRIAGTATLRTVLSSTGIATDRIATAAATQRRGSSSGAGGLAVRFFSDVDGEVTSARQPLIACAGRSAIRAAKIPTMSAVEVLCCTVVAVPLAGEK